MDAQGRGRDEGIDPADQWVLNPNTGDYELRLTPSSGRSSASAGTTDARTPGTRRRPKPGTPPSGDRASVPGQRGGRRGAGGGRGDRDETRKPGGRAAAPPATGRRKAKPQKSRKKKALVWTGGVLAFLMVGVGTTGYLVYQHFNGNITSAATDGAGTGGFSKDRAINVLVTRAVSATPTPTSSSTSPRTARTRPR